MITISAHDLQTFLDQAVEALTSKGEIEAAVRFEIFRDYITEDVITKRKPFTFNRGISLGL